MFDRQEREAQEHIDDAECIGALAETLSTPRRAEKQSTIVTYRFPEQDGGLRLPTRLDHVSQAMIDATVSTEDVNF